MGGAVVTYTQYGKKYQAHVFKFDSPNEFVVTPEMENVPMEYLIIAGGGSGASNKTSNNTGAGGGGAGGGDNRANRGGYGGSGIVIIRYQVA